MVTSSMHQIAICSNYRWTETVEFITAIWQIRCVFALLPSQQAICKSVETCRQYCFRESLDERLGAVGCASKRDQGRGGLTIILASIMPRALLNLCADASHQNCQQTLTSLTLRTQVKSAYRKLCLQHHPDLFPSDQRAAAEVRFRTVVEAYNRLYTGVARQDDGCNQDPYARAHACGRSWWCWRQASCSGCVLAKCNILLTCCPFHVQAEAERTPERPRTIRTSRGGRTNGRARRRSASAMAWWPPRCACRSC